MHLASLKEKNDQRINTLQNIIDQKQTQIQHLSQQIAAKEDQIKQQTNTLDSVELERVLELEDMKMKIIELEYERDCANTAAKRAQEEASLNAEALLTATQVHP